MDEIYDTSVGPASLILLTRSPVYNGQCDTFEEEVRTENTVRISF